MTTGTGPAATVTGGSLRGLCVTVAGDRAAAGRSVRVAAALVNLPPDIAMPRVPRDQTSKRGALHPWARVAFSS